MVRGFLMGFFEKSKKLVFQNKICIFAVFE